LATVDSTQASLGLARAEEQRARAALAQAQRDLARTRRLTTAGVATPQDLEAREADALVAEEAVNAAAFAVQAASAEVERAQARVGTSVPARGGGAVVVKSPADGVVLQRLRESESVV